MKLPERGESGATTVEYGLLVTLIAAVIIASVLMLGGTTSDSLGSVCRELEAVDQPC